MRISYQEVGNFGWCWFGGTAVTRVPTHKYTSWKHSCGSGVLEHVTVENNVVVGVGIDAFLSIRPELKPGTTEL